MKKFIVVLVVGLLLTSGAYAAGTIKSASFNADTKIQIDGKIIPMEMIAVVLDGESNGKNYVSIKELAEAMGGKVNYNDTTKTIEINTKEVEAVSTITTQEIQYDTVTGLPEGAEYIDNEKEGQKYKTVKYNDEIYISSSDLEIIFGIKSNSLDIKNGIRIFSKNSIDVSVNLRSDDYFNANSRSYYKLSLFAEIIGG